MEKEGVGKLAEGLQRNIGLTSLNLEGMRKYCKALPHFYYCCCFVILCSE